jgi:hypothetical protein
MKKSQILASVIVVSLGLASQANATSSVCDAVAGNLVQNCGFEGGTYTSGPNTSVPNDWTSNAAFDDFTSFNNVRFAPINSGVLALSIGNTDPEPVPTLSQTLADVSGTTYSGSLFVNYGGAGDNDSSVFFNVQINGADVVSLDDSAPGTYTEYTFSFTGTGSDELTLTGNTTPSEWFVDDVVVTGSSGPTPVPEPTSLGVLGAAVGGLGLYRRRKKV